MACSLGDMDAGTQQQTRLDRRLGDVARKRERAETQICTQSGMQREEVGTVDVRVDNQLTDDLIGFQQRR